MRPRIINNPQEFALLVDCYVAECKEEKRSMSIPGLALYLGLTGKSSFYQYGEREGFEDVVEYAKSLIEQQYIERVTDGKADRGNAFLLKAIYGYRDTTVVEVAPMKVVIEGKDALL